MHCKGFSKFKVSVLVYISAVNISVIYAIKEKKTNYSLCLLFETPYFGHKYLKLREINECYSDRINQQNKITRFFTSEKEERNSDFHSTPVNIKFCFT